MNAQHPSPDEWKRLEELFLAAVELPDDERAAFMDRECSTDATLRAELESLLTSDRAPARSIPDVLEQAASSLLGWGQQAGRRLGPYRITEQLGAGGMGVVYLAARDDDEFHKRVAIKLVRGSVGVGDLRERLRQERQILAGLDHPYIARLLDGATTEDGSPYFVLEYVEGTPIDAWCDSHDANIEQRCVLFRKACEAVSYAHRNLVIHRDLKPSHIMVDADGMPKLLDFGIAKLLPTGGDGAATAATNTLQWVLTPDFASPEQVRGEPVTTGTDIYSLGAVLYRLLTGINPHRLEAYTPSEVERVVCFEEPQKPSLAARNPAWRKRLRGDLDNIVLMAMRKEPERRYGSVDQFSEDLRRYLEGLPVSAREDTVRYRTGKFLKRHRAWAAASVFMSLSLTTGTAVAIRQAQRAQGARAIAESQRELAESARQQAEVERGNAFAAGKLAEAKALEAEAQRKLAEQRLSAFIEFAKRSAFGMQHAIERLPGGTEARQQIAKTTLEFLDDLNRSAGDDPRVLRLLTDAYTRLGNVQGLPFRSSLGNPAEALASYRKALAIVRRLPPDAEMRFAEAQLDFLIGTVLEKTSERQEALASYERGLRVARQLEREQPGNADAVKTVGLISASLAREYFAANIDRKKAIELAETQLASYRKLVLLLPGNDEAEDALVSAYSVMGTMLSKDGKLKEALVYAMSGAEIRERVCKRHPNDTVLKRNLMLSYGHIGDWMGYPLGPNLGDLAGAKNYFEKAQTIAEELAKADPADRTAQMDVATILMRVGIVASKPEEREQSLAALRRSTQISESLLKTSPRDRTVQLNLATTCDYTGTRLSDSGSYDEALASYRRALEVAGRLFSDNPQYLQALNQMFETYKGLAVTRARQGDRNGALSEVQRARKAAEAFSARESKPVQPERYFAMVDLSLGLVYDALARGGGEPASERLADWKQARDAFARSQASWAVVQDPSGMFRTQLDEVAGKLRSSEREVRLLEQAGGGSR